MKKFCFLLCLFLIAGCASEKEPYEDIQRKITRSYINSSKNNDSLYLSSYGGKWDEFIERINLGFDLINQQLEIAEARILIVKKVEDFLEMINNNEEIREFLIEYPFPPERFEVSISFINSEIDFIRPPYIAFVSIQSGKIFYSIYDTKRETLYTIYSETYEEAYRIVYGQEAP